MKPVPSILCACGLASLVGWSVGRSQRWSYSAKPTAASEWRTPGKRIHHAEVDAAAESSVGPGQSARNGMPWRAPIGEREIFAARVRAATATGLAEMAASLGRPPEPPWAAEALLQAWAERDPAGACRYYEQLPVRSRFALIENLVRGWARGDEDGAIAWLAAQPATVPVMKARSSALGEIAKTDPARAMEILRQRGWLLDSPEALRAVFVEWVESDPAEAMGQWRELNRALNPPAQPDGLLPVPPFTDELIRSSIEAAAARGPSGVRQAIDLFTAGELAARPRVLLDIARRHDPSLVFPALEAKLPVGTMRELVQWITGDHPEMASKLARVLVTPELIRLTASPAPERGLSSDDWPDAPDDVSGDRVTLDP